MRAPGSPWASGGPRLGCAWPGIQERVVIHASELTGAGKPAGASLSDTPSLKGTLLLSNGHVRSASFWQVTELNPY